MSTSEAILIAASPAKSDETLLREVEELVREHTGLVFRITYSVLRNRQDSEDAAQETFMRVLRYRQRLSTIEDRKSWLARIAWRVAVEGPGRGRQFENAEWSDALVYASANTVSAEQAMQEEQTSAMLAKFIAELNGDLRDVITLSTVQELNSREIGEVLGIPETTVRTRQMRAREILKQKFATALSRK